MLNKDEDKIVYFVRHGQSEANVTPVFQGPDSPLTNEGKRQAELIAKRVAQITFDKLISSPWPRATETAQVIAKATNIVPEYSDLFRERIKPASIAGKPISDKQAADLWDKWNRSLTERGLRVEEGENFDDIIARADKALDFLKEQTVNNIVVVTHGYFLKTILCRAVIGEALTPEIFKKFQTRVITENTGISVLKYGTRFEGTFWRLWIFNDHAHLG